MIYTIRAVYNDAREYSTTFPVAPDPHDKIFRVSPKKNFFFFSHPAENITMTPLCIPPPLVLRNNITTTQPAPHPLHIRLVNKVQLSFVFYFFVGSVQTAGRDLS